MSRILGIAIWCLLALVLHRVNSIDVTTEAITDATTEVPSLPINYCSEAINATLLWSVLQEGLAPGRSGPLDAVILLQTSGTLDQDILNRSQTLLQGIYKSLLFYVHPDFARLSHINFRSEINSLYDFVSADATANELCNVLALTRRPLRTENDDPDFTTAFNMALYVFDNSTRVGSKKALFILSTGEGGITNMTESEMNELTNRGIVAFVIALSDNPSAAFYETFANHYFACLDTWEEVFATENLKPDSERVKEWYTVEDKNLTCRDDGTIKSCNIYNGDYKCLCNLHHQSKADGVCEACPTFYCAFQYDSTSCEMCPGIQTIIIAVASAVGGLLLILTIIAIICCVRLRRRKTADKEAQNAGRTRVRNGHPIVFDPSPEQSVDVPSPLNQRHSVIQPPVRSIIQSAISRSQSNHNLENMSLPDTFKSFETELDIINKDPQLAAAYERKYSNYSNLVAVESGMPGWDVYLSEVINDTVVSQVAIQSLTVQHWVVSVGFKMTGEVLKRVTDLLNSDQSSSKKQQQIDIRKKRYQIVEKTREYIRASWTPAEGVDESQETLIAMMSGPYVIIGITVEDDLGLEGIKELYAIRQHLNSSADDMAIYSNN